MFRAACEANESMDGFVMEPMNIIEPIMERYAVFSTSLAGSSLNAARDGYIGYCTMFDSCFSWLSVMTPCSSVDISVP